MKIALLSTSYLESFYKKELKDENVANGKQMLDYEAKRQAVNLPSLLKNNRRKLPDHIRRGSFRLPRLCALFH